MFDATNEIVREIIRVLLLTGLAFFVALFFTPTIDAFLRRRRLGKNIRPVLRDLHGKKAGTPTMGGVIIWGTVLGLALVFFLLSFFFDGVWDRLSFVDRAETYLPIAAMLLAALLGLFDDLLGVFKKGGPSGGIKVRHKLIIYVLLAVVGAWWFYVKLGFGPLHVPFVGFIEIGSWYIPFFMFIIIATAFSANETDGLDGLLGGVSLFAFGALTVVAFSLGRYDLAAFSGVVIGALLAFLWFNIYPARFIMGDTGSMALGITIGVIAMLTNTALFLPFFAIIFVAESLSVVLQLISRYGFHKKLFLFTPLHHHFEMLDWPETQITMRFWIVSAVFAALGLVLFVWSRFLLLG